MNTHTGYRAWYIAGDGCSSVSVCLSVEVKGRIRAMGRDCREAAIFNGTVGAASLRR